MQAQTAENLRRALQACDVAERKSVSIIDGFSRKLMATETPPTIYHYTDQTGFLGIIKSGKIWFSNLLKQTDPSELRFGLHHALGKIKAISEVSTGHTQEFFLRILAALDRQDAIATVAHHQVACFSSNGDLLEQWRAYADDGHGFSLGFRTELLEKRFINSGMSPFAPSPQTFPVSYGSAELQSMQDEVIGAFEQAVKKVATLEIAEQQRLGFFKKLSVTLTLHLLHLAFYFKHTAYRREVEYRFLKTYGSRTPRIDFKFRESYLKIVEFTEFDWKVVPMALSKIVIGPSAPKEKTREFVHDVLKAYMPIGYAIDIETSSIPYNGRPRGV